MFEKKTWINRQSEHPARRRLTPTGNDNEYDVARAEGVIMEDGDAFDAETMNDLEKRVAEGFSTLDPADLGADVCVQVYACVKSGTVYELTGSGAVGRCKIPAAWNTGDTWSVNGKAVPAYCGADAVDSDCIVAGRWVLFTFDGQRLDFNGGGGLSSGKLAQATAAESDVLSGKKFYAGNKNLKTGTLALSGSAGTGDVLRGATFYKESSQARWRSPATPMPRRCCLGTRSTKTTPNRSRPERWRTKARCPRPLILVVVIMFQLGTTTAAAR